MRFLYKADGLKHYEEIIAGYNNEKDRVTIERTFEALMILVESLDEEEQRAVKDGFDEETLTLFDLLLKPDLSKQEIIRIKKVTQGLYKTLQSEISKIQDFHAKQSTRDNIKVAIKDFLWSYKTGLPESFAPEEIEEKTEIVFSHVLMGARNSNSDWRVEPT